jgi:hypothetical protein
MTSIEATATEIMIATVREAAPVITMAVEAALVTMMAVAVPAITADAAGRAS